jgi:hypothetical protein
LPEAVNKSLGVQSLVDLNGRDAEDGDSDSMELKDLIDHWVQAIDRWVQRIDQGMGGTAEGVDLAAEPDPTPEAG